MKRLRKLFTENVGLKLLSLALAVALWAALGSDPVTEATFRVPIEFINVPSNIEVLSEQPSVQLWARGPSHAVRAAEPENFTVRVNVAALDGLGTHTFSLDPARVEAPASLKVVEMNPSAARVTLEATVHKEVPIDPRFSGEPAAGYRLKEFHLSPAQARITGPSSHVNPITAVATDPIDMSQLKDRTNIVTNVYVPDPLVRFASDRGVTVTVVMEKAAAPNPPR